MINTTKHLCFVLKTSLVELEKIIDNLDNYYYTKIQEKKDDQGKPKLKNGFTVNRILYPSIGRLKVIQRRIQRDVLNHLPVPEYAFGSVRGKDNIQNARRHQGKKHIFSTDLRSFFPYIDHHKVFQMFLINGFSPTVARILTKLTTYKGELPQGTPTAPIISNLVFVKTGNKLNDFANTNGLTFSTYIDDVTFSSAQCFKSLIVNIMKIITADGYKIATKKTYYRTRFPEVTGVIVKNNELDLHKKYKDRINSEGKSGEQMKGINNYIARVRLA